MPRRNSNSRDRDEQGRFASDNYRGRSSRYHDDEDDNDSRYSSRSSRYDSDYDDEDDNRYSSRSSRGGSNSCSGSGQGWFGDSEVHARAGSLSHGGRGRSSGYDDYDDEDEGRYSSRSNRSSNRHSGGY